MLATYLGHGFGVVSTHYYLHFIEPLRTAASERFARHYGELVYAVRRAGKEAPMKREPQPNLLGAVMRDYFTDHLPASSRNEPAHHPQLP